MAEAVAKEAPQAVDSSKVAESKPAIRAKASKTKAEKPKAATPKKAVAKSKASKSYDHPKYIEMVTEAILALKERTGSSSHAIAKFIEQKHKSHLPENWKTHLGTQLKNLTKAGKLVKVKASFKLSENLKAGAKKPVTAPKKPVSAGKVVKSPKKTGKAVKAPKPKSIKAARKAPKPTGPVVKKAKQPEAKKKAPAVKKIVSTKKQSTKKSPLKKVAPKKAQKAGKK